MDVKGDSGLGARAVVVRRGHQCVIEGLELSVPRGSVYALLGGNGAGKTTTLNAFLGFAPIESGELCVDGIRVREQPDAARARIAYLPENVALYPYLSGIENLVYFSALADIRIGHAEARAMLDAAGLQQDAHSRRVGRYSKGMRQKVGLAIAYAKNATAMLLDEPTSGLDPSAANEFALRVREARDRGLAVLMATHDLFNARQVADRIGILKAGRLVDEFDAASVDHDRLERTYLAHARGMEAPVDGIDIGPSGTRGGQQRTHAERLSA